MKRIAARFILIWFALSVGVAIASPWVSPQMPLGVCSASGDPFAADGDDGSSAGGSPRMDCPMCQPFTAPFSVPSIPAFGAVDSGATTVEAIAPDPASHASAAPLSARGPPLTA